MNTGLFLSGLGMSATLFVSACGALAADQETLIPVQQGEMPTDTRAGVTFISEELRDPPFEFAGITLSGSALSSADFTGGPTVVNFWASWCEPCRAELPELAQAAGALGPSGVNFLGINVEDDANAAAEFAEQMPYPSIRDTSGEILASVPDVPPSALPITVMLDTQGRIAARIIGPTTAETLKGLAAQLGSA